MFALNESLVVELVLKKYGKLTMPSHFGPTGAGGVDRTTLWRSFKKQELPSIAVIFSLAGLLDVDPMAIITIKKMHTFPEVFGFFEKYLWAVKKPKQFNKILKLSEYLASQHEWPSENFSQKYYGRHWIKKTTKHEANGKTNYYGKIEINFKDIYTPKVIHISWRSNTKDQWHTYGAVRIFDQEIDLISYGGDSQNVCISQNHERFIVETWFGSETAEFCVASLHDFDIRQVEIADKSLSTVCFKTR